MCISFKTRNDGSDYDDTWLAILLVLPIFMGPFIGSLLSLLNNDKFWSCLAEGALFGVFSIVAVIVIGGTIACGTN